MSEIYLNHLSEDILARVIDFTGSPWLHELLKVGNRLLISKILYSHAITSYSNLNYYGKPSSWSESVIIRLQGLKSLILKNPFSPALWDAPSSSLLLNLPKSVTEIDLETVNCLRLCNASAKDNSNLLSFDFRIYPNLNSVALRCPQEMLASNSENSTYIEKHFPEEIRIPPSLTKFELIWPLKNIMSHIMRLPKTLCKLGFLVDQMSGISWIHQFPDLQELRIDSVPELELIDQEAEVELVKPHPALKIVRFENLYLVTPDNQRVSPLFAHFVNVESLSIPRLEFHHSHLSTLKNLRYLECDASVDSESLSGDIVNCEWYSTKLVELHCRIVTNSMVEKLRQLPSLSILTTGQMPFESMKELPTSLTRLTISATHATIPEIGEAFPALVYLCIERFSSTFQPSDLASLGPNLLVCQAGDETYVRVQDESLSLDGECGWTDLVHAASEWDFESMDKILQTQVIKTTEWLKRLMRDYAWYHNVTLEVFEWLRVQGVLAEPHCVGSLLFSPLFDIALDLKETSLVTWALDLLTDREWALMAGHFVGLLAKCREYDLLYSTAEKRNINASPPHTRVALSHIIQQSFIGIKDEHNIILWLVEHGHASLHLFELIYWVGRDWDGRSFTPWVIDLLRLLTSPTGSALHEKSDEVPSHSSEVHKRPKWGSIKIPVFGYDLIETMSVFEDPTLTPTSKTIFDLFSQYGCFRCGQISTLEFLDCLIQVFGMNPNETTENNEGLCELLIEIILSSALTPENDNWILAATEMFIEHKVQFVFSVPNSCSIAHASVQRGLLPLIRLLIDHGVDFEQVNGSDKTAFDLMPSELRKAATQRS